MRKQTNIKRGRWVYKWSHIAIIALILSCSQEDTSPKMGCITAINKSDPEEKRISIACRTYDQFLAGSNVNTGGIARWDYYKQHQWKEVSNCDKCR